MGLLIAKFSIKPNPDRYMEHAAAANAVTQLIEEGSLRFGDFAR